MIGAVLDTNVVAAGAVGLETTASTPGVLLRCWLDDRFMLITSEPILTELANTFAKPYFLGQLGPERIPATFELVRRRAMVVAIAVEVRGVAAHAQDDMVLATAVSAGAAFIVTGDYALQSLGAYQGVAIVSPRAFLDTLDRAAGR